MRQPLPAAAGRPSTPIPRSGVQADVRPARPAQQELSLQPEQPPRATLSTVGMARLLGLDPLPAPEVVIHASAGVQELDAARARLVAGEVLAQARSAHDAANRFETQRCLALDQVASRADWAANAVSEVGEAIGVGNAPVSGQSVRAFLELMSYSPTWPVPRAVSWGIAVLTTVPALTRGMADAMEAERRHAAALAPPQVPADETALRVADAAFSAVMRRYPAKASLHNALSEGVDLAVSRALDAVFSLPDEMLSRMHKLAWVCRELRQFAAGLPATTPTHADAKRFQALVACIRTTTASPACPAELLEPFEDFFRTIAGGNPWAMAAFAAGSRPADACAAERALLGGIGVDI